jgi:multiple sugar transport system permease protein
MEGSRRHHQLGAERQPTVTERFSVAGRPKLARLAGRPVLVRQFFLSIPKDLEDAARVNGAGDFRVYRSLVLRMSVPAVLTLGLFHFMYNWNDLLWPLIVSSNSSMYTLPAGLALFLGQHVILYGLVMAGSVLAIVPMVIAFLLVQRRFVETIALSGLK